MTIALLVALFAGTACGVRLLATQLPAGTDLSPRDVFRPWPIVTSAALVVIATVSVLQLTVWPDLLTWLERDADAIGRGQIWRLFTSTLVQDGGVAGLLSNLAFLALLGTLAERTLGRRPLIVAWCTAVLCGELAGLWWQPIGAGNSVGNLGLAGVLAVAAATIGTAEATVAASAVALSATVLLAGTDIHGAALVGGAVTGLVPWARRRRRRPTN